MNEPFVTHAIAVFDSTRPEGEPEPAAPRAVRAFEHGAAECLTQSPLFMCCQGKIEFVADPDAGPDGHPRGLVLALVEFLTRMLHRPPPSERHATRWACVLPEYPAYMPLLSRMFPHVHFYAYSAPDPTGDEYAPEAPGARVAPYRPADCDGNVTALCQAFDSEAARLLGGRARSRTDRVYLVCSDRHTATRQMLYHTLAKPAYSLLSIRGLIPDEYLSGDLFYPLYTPVSSGLVHLVAPGNACARLYFPMWMRDELAYFQVLVRTGTDYDARAEAQILADYLRAVWGHADPGQCEWLRAALPAV